MKHALVQEGDRFLTVDDFPTSGIAAYGAPYSGGFNCIVPAGTTLIAEQDQIEGAVAFYCRPENYEQLERSLVPEVDRDDKYLGYSLVCHSAEIGGLLKLMS